MQRSVAAVIRADEGELHDEPGRDRRGWSRAAGEGEAVWFTNTLMKLKATAESTGGAYGLVEAIAPAGFATPLHVHHREAEGFWVLEGELTVKWRADVLGASRLVHVSPAQGPSRVRRRGRLARADPVVLHARRLRGVLRRRRPSCGDRRSSARRPDRPRNARARRKGLRPRGPGTGAVAAGRALRVAGLPLRRWASSTDGTARGGWSG